MRRSVRFVLVAVTHALLAWALEAAPRTHPYVEWALVALAAAISYLTAAASPWASHSVASAAVTTIEGGLAPCAWAWLAHLVGGVLWRAHWMHHPGMQDLAHPVVRAAQGVGLYVFALALGVPFAQRPDLAPVLIAGALALCVLVPPGAPNFSPWLAVARSVAHDVCVALAAVVIGAAWSEGDVCIGVGVGASVGVGNAAAERGVGGNSDVEAALGGETLLSSPPPPFHAAFSLPPPSSSSSSDWEHVVSAAAVAVALQGAWVMTARDALSLGVGVLIQCSFLVLYVTKTHRYGLNALLYPPVARIGDSASPEMSSGARSSSASASSLEQLATKRHTEERALHETRAQIAAAALASSTPMPASNAAFAAFTQPALHQAAAAAAGYATTYPTLGGGGGGGAAAHQASQYAPAPAPAQPSQAASPPAYRTPLAQIAIPPQPASSQPARAPAQAPAQAQAPTTPPTPSSAAPSAQTSAAMLHPDRFGRGLGIRTQRAPSSVGGGVISGVVLTRTPSAGVGVGVGLGGAGANNIRAAPALRAPTTQPHF